jgi:hypothetical protein
MVTGQMSVPIIYTIGRLAGGVVGKAQKLGRKMALLQAYLRGESKVTKHQLIQFGQIDTSVEAVQKTLNQLSRVYEQAKTPKQSTGRIPQGIGE